MFLRTRLSKRTKPSGTSFRSTPELNEEIGSDYRRNRRRESDRIQAAYLLRAEAVAKLSSFRQLRFSSIRNYSAVIGVTVARDVGQQASATVGSGLHQLFFTSED